MKTSRRGFIGGLGALFLCAPAIVQASSLMPVSNRLLIKDYMVLYGWDLYGNQIEEWTEMGCGLPAIADVRPKWAEVTGFGPGRMVSHAFHAVHYTGIKRDPFYVGWGRGLAQYNPDPELEFCSQNALVCESL